MNYWDVARLTKLPGATVTTLVDPAGWTNRMKNSVKRMIMEGVARGGGSSVAVVLTKGLADYHGMQIRREYGTNDAEGANLTDAQVTQIHELIMGDFAAWRMEHGDQSHNTWRANQITETIEKLMKTKSYDHNFLSIVNARKARKITPLIRSQEDLDRSKRICESIDHNEVFTFNVTRG
jgi:2,3-bisphosphoglycerate-independent phosphoglycerate mutase